MEERINKAEKGCETEEEIEVHTHNPNKQATRKTEKERYSQLETNETNSESKSYLQQLATEDHPEANNLHQYDHRSLLTKECRTETILDNESGELRVVKSFMHEDDFEEEKNFYENLIKDFIGYKDKLPELAILPTEYNILNNEIYFVPGVCTLEELLDEQNFKLNAELAVHIFITLLEFMLLIREKGYYHLSNLKPENMQIVRFEENVNGYILKVMDFASIITKVEHIHTTVASEDSLSFNENELLESQNMNEGFENEFYTLLETFHFILMKTQDEKFFESSNDFSELDRQMKLKEMCEELNEKYRQENNEIHHILQFVIEERSLEFTINELNTLLKTLKSKAPSEEKYLHDSEEIIFEIEEQRLLNARKEAGPLALFVRLRNFTNPIGSQSEEYSDPFDLLFKLKEIIFESDQLINNILIIGNSGAGKTLLLIKLKRELEESECNCDIAHINLRDLNVKNESKKQILNLLYLRIKNEIRNEKKFLLVLLDGYDELITKELKINNLIRQNFKEYLEIKIIITTSSQLSNLLDLEDTFGQHIEIFIRPFKNEQQKNLIENFLESERQYKFYLNEQQEVLSKEYLEIINAEYYLNKICEYPLTLSLVLHIIDKLKEEVDRSIVFYTKYKIFDVFITDYTTERIQTIAEEYENILSEKYGEQDFSKVLFSDEKEFNEFCSWLMLEEQKQKLDTTDIESVFDKISIFSNKSLSAIFGLFERISPTDIAQKEEFCYIHKSFQEFYVAESIVEETLNAECEALDETKSIISTSYLRFDLDVLSLVADHVMEMPLRLQYELFFETWYKSILLTRKICNITNDKELVRKLETIGSNCMNLLAANPRCDLTNRDFSNCAIPHTYFYKRDLSGCNFTFTNMEYCNFTATGLNKSKFIGTNLKDLKYGKQYYLLGHNDGIWEVSFSPDSQYLASSSEDFSIKIWSIESQQELATLSMHDENIYSVTFSTDGKYLACGCEDKTVKLYNFESEKLVTSLKGHSSLVNSVAFSYDGKELASGSDDTTIKLWSIERYHLITTLRGHTLKITAVSFSSDSKYLASSSYDFNIKLWSVESQRELTTLEGHGDIVNSLAFSKNCKYLVSGSCDSTIKLWSTEEQKLIATMQDDSRKNIKAVSFSPDNQCLAAGSNDGKVKLWNIKELKQVETLSGFLDYVLGVSFSPDGKYLASCSWDKAIKLESVESYKEIVALKGHKSHITSIAFSVDSKYFASASGDHTVRLWSLDSLEEFNRLRGHSHSVTSVAFSRDGKYLASGSRDRTVKIWSLDTQKVLATLEGHTQCISSIAFSPDSRYLASGSFDNSVKLWSVKSCKEVNALQGLSEEVTSVAFEPAGKYLAFGLKDGLIKLWNIEEQLEVIEIEGHEKFVTSVAFSPDGRYMASGGGDCTINIWNFEPLNKLISLEGHREEVSAITFSPDTKYLASGSYDNTVIVWSVESHKVLSILQGHSNYIRAVSFSNDGKYLASGSGDNSLKLWIVDTFERKKERSEIPQEDSPSMLFPQEEKTRE